MKIHLGNSILKESFFVQESWEGLYKDLKDYCNIIEDNISLQEKTVEDMIYYLETTFNYQIVLEYRLIIDKLVLVVVGQNTRTKEHYYPITDIDAAIFQGLVCIVESIIADIKIKQFNQ